MSDRKKLHLGIDKLRAQRLPEAKLREIAAAEASKIIEKELGRRVKEVTSATAA